jgi:phytoene dehydrogenase-like protein
VRTVDVIVVGGGVAGLVGAAFASKGGASVLLLEASPVFGGRARTRIVSGYHFNRGAHALYRGGFLDKALQDLGVDVRGGVPALAAGFLSATASFIGPLSVPQDLPRRRCCPTRRKAS